MKSGAPRDATLRRLALVIVTNSMGFALAMQKCFARGERGIDARAPRRKREARPTAGATARPLFSQWIEVQHYSLNITFHLLGQSQ